MAFSSLVESAASKIAPEIAGAFGQAFGATDEIFEFERQQSLLSRNVKEGKRQKAKPNRHAG